MLAQNLIQGVQTDAHQSALSVVSERSDASVNRPSVPQRQTVQWPEWGMAVVAMADARAVSLSVHLTDRQGTGGIRTVF